jgi:predicted ATPase
VITHAYISRFKSVADAHITFGPVNILVGRNANGKSNIVDALYFVHDAISEDLDTAIVKRHGIESIRQYSKTRPYNITVELSITTSTGHGKYRFGLASGRGSYRVIEESAEWIDADRLHSGTGPPLSRTTTFRRDHTGKVALASDPPLKNSPPDSVTISSSELFGTTIAGPAFTMYAALLRPLMDDIQSFVSYAIYPNTLREPRVVSRLDQLASDGSNLPSILRLINTGRRVDKESLINAVRLVMPNIVDITTRSAGGYYVPIVQVREPGGDTHSFNMSQISDGTLRVLGMLTAFYQPNAPRVIALEEPEQMVHPGVLPILADAAKEYVSGGIGGRQVFMTTHSPAMLDLFEPEDIIWTKQVDGITRCGPINARQLGAVKNQLFTAGELFTAEGFNEQ